MKLHISQLPCDEATFLEKLDAYKAERAAHALTVDVPAPLPEYEIFRTIVDQGGELALERDPPPSLRELALRALAEQQAAKDASARLAAEDALLAEAALDPNAPQAVKDYVVLEQASLSE